MSFEDYDRALKMGKKAYRNSIIRGEYPYLPVLDDILSVAEIRGDVNLGLVDIPLDRVVGTSNKGRTYSFASNVMPILDFKTEFTGALRKRFGDRQELFYFRHLLGLKFILDKRSSGIQSSWTCRKTPPGGKEPSRPSRTRP